MLRLIWASVLYAAASVASAQSPFTPGLFNVVGVAQDDVLNVRNAPNAATSEIIGTFAWNAADIEVVRTEGRWGLINQHGRFGWIHMGFVQAQTLNLRNGTLPIQRCIGNEPFWSLAIDGTQATFTTPQQPVGMPQSVTFHPSANHVHRFAVVGPTFVMTVQHGDVWTDGMSDQVYGFSADIWLPEQNMLMTGVCSLR